MDLQKGRVTEMIRREDRSKWSSHSNHDIKCFTEGEIQRITSNYGVIIGKGAFGEVYRGILKDGSTVAVKRFVRNVEEDFAKELKVHSEINHKNVVRLIGYCAEENALMIVTEYISKGNLSDILHHDCISIVLDTRLRIAVECSEALCYMHSQMYTQVIHGDIKPANILLDNNLNAKVSDFGISRLVNTDATLFTEHVIGSIGYMDPLFARYGRLTSKSDVYSFGIVLLELITKKKATVRRGEIGIVESFTKALATGITGVRELFDVEISSQNNMKVLEGVAKLAGECLWMDMDRRPEMIEVAERLRALRKTEGWRNKPEAQSNDQSSSASGVHLPLPLSSKVGRHFSLDEIKSATGNFQESHHAGMGKNGELYYGVIDRGATKVAIIRWRSVYDMKNFERGIVTRAELCHRHLISLIGHCKENYGMILVYEYMAGGTLHGRLYGDNTEEPPLTWRQRLVICIGAARALQYLQKCSIIHCDLTTRKIFLDHRLVAKVSCPISSGYADPKSDVYSFGVVMFEVLCAQGVWDQTRPSKRVPLVEYVLNCRSKGILDQIVDPCLEGKITPRCLNKFVETAEQCVGSESVDRPSMREVLRNLEMCLAAQSLDEETADWRGGRPRPPRARGAPFPPRRGGGGTSLEQDRPCSMEERPQNLEMHLSDERLRYKIELSPSKIPDGR